MNGAERKAMLYLPERGKAQLGEGAPPGVEDTAVVTDDGIEIFTSGAPLELDDVEALMGNEGTQLPYLLTGSGR